MKSIGTHPVAPEVQFEAIDPQLKQNNQWLCWKYVQKKNKWAKVPFQINGRTAKTTTSATWSSYDDALDAYLYEDHQFDGIGYVFTEDDGIVGIDIDDCIDDEGNWSDLAREVVKKIPGYCEITPSGRGLHLITQANLDRAHKDDSIGLEVYTKGRYFTVTGNVVNGHQSISDGNLGWLIEKHFQNNSSPAKSSTGGLENHKTGVDLDDRQIEKTLTYLDPDIGYDRWLNVGMALHHQYGGDAKGLDLWDSWSQRSVDYSYEELNWKWSSFDSADLNRNPVTFASVIKWAKKAKQDAAMKGVGNFLNIRHLLETAPPKRKFLLKDPETGDGFVPEGEICGIAAPGSTGKTMVLLQMAVSRAAKLPWLDHYEPTDAGHAYLFTTEDSAEEIHRRLKGVTDRFIDYWTGESPKLDESLVMLLEKNLHLKTLRGTDFLITENEDGSLVTGAGAKAIVEIVGSCPGGLVILDPLRAMMDGKEDEVGFSAVVRALQWIARETLCTILISHHSSQVSQLSKDLTEAAFRGATALKDGLRWTMVMQGVSEDSANKLGISRIKADLRQISMPKTNYSRSADGGVFLQWTPQGFTRIDSVAKAQQRAEREAAAAAQTLEQNKELLFELMKDLQSREITPSQRNCWEHNTTNLTKTAIESTHRALQADGRIVVTGSGRGMSIELSEDSAGADRGSSDDSV